MKLWLRILALCGALAFMGIIDNTAVSHAVISGHDMTQEELKSDQPLMPLSHEEAQTLSAPVQVPAIVPSQGSRLLTPAKYRTTLSRTNILRRLANRLSDNVYAPLALSGQFVVERVTSPLPHRTVYYHVITLCRPLC